MCDALILISMARHSGHNRVHNFHRTQMSREQTVVQQPHASAFPSFLYSLLSISFPFLSWSQLPLLSGFSSGRGSRWDQNALESPGFLSKSIHSAEDGECVGAESEKRRKVDLLGDRSGNNAVKGGGCWEDWLLPPPPPPWQKIVGSGPGPVYIVSMRPD